LMKTCDHPKTKTCDHLTMRTCGHPMMKIYDRLIQTYGLMRVRDLYCLETTFLYPFRVSDTPLMWGLQDTN